MCVGNLTVCFSHLKTLGSAYVTVHAGVCRKLDSSLFSLKNLGICWWSACLLDNSDLLLSHLLYTPPVNTKLYSTLLHCSDTLEHTSKSHHIFSVSSCFQIGTQNSPFPNMAWSSMCTCVAAGYMCLTQCICGTCVLYQLLLLIAFI